MFVQKSFVALAFNEGPFVLLVEIHQLDKNQSGLRRLELRSCGDLKDEQSSR